VSAITITVLICKVGDAAASAAAATGDDAGGAASPSMWSSSHTVGLQLDRDYQIDCVANSTIYLESQAKPCRFSGHVTRPTKRHAVPIPEALHAVFEQDRGSLHNFVAAGGDAAKQLVIATVGKLVQQVENRLRDVTASVYFGKCGQVATDLRCPVGRNDSTAARMIDTRGGTASAAVGGGSISAVPAFPQVDAAGLPIVAKPVEIPQRKMPDVAITASVPLPPQQRYVEEVPAPASAPAAAAEAEPQYFTAEQDENGDTYYMPESGDGEAVWELPEGAVVREKPQKKEKKSKKDKKQQREQEEEEAAAAAAAAEEEQAAAAEDGGEEGNWTIAGVLAGLELAEGSAEEYAELFAAAGVETVEDMLQLDEKYLKKTVGIASSADRKTISAWIDETYASMAGEEE
jgi:hypothetical protein